MKCKNNYDDIFKKTIQEYNPIRYEKNFEAPIKTVVLAPEQTDQRNKTESKN